jgi:hypothetical protein
MSFRVLRGRDEDEDSFVRHQITQTLSSLVGELGFHDVQKELENGSFTVIHLPIDDQGPNYEDYVFKENVESGTGNCLDVSWL